jgi:uncharacterized protein with von Willebrand factor type A (vWA) domain
VLSVEPAGDSAVLEEEDRRIDFDTVFFEQLFVAFEDDADKSLLPAVGVLFVNRKERQGERALRRVKKGKNVVAGFRDLLNLLRIAERAHVFRFH